MNTSKTYVPGYAGQLIEFHDEMYRNSLELGNSQGLLESACILCVAFTAVGNSALAAKWAEAFFKHLPDSSTDTHVDCH
jgi:hypothetical protein